MNPRLLKAHELYQTILEMVMSHFGFGDNRLVETEQKLAGLSYILHSSLNGDDSRYNRRAGLNATGLNSHQYPLYNSGTQALKRALAYAYNHPKPRLGDVLFRLLDLADWYLLFNQVGIAHKTYEEAIALLQTAGISAQEIELFMEAGSPVEIPSSIYTLSTENRSYNAFIDVEFKVNQYGLASQLTLLSPSEHPVVEHELRKLIRNSKFRPAFREGLVMKATRVQLRYFYTPPLEAR